MTVEMTEPEEMPSLAVSINVPEEEYPDSAETEITIEMSLDNQLVLILAFPHNGELLELADVTQLFAIASQALPTILEQMEAHRG